MAKEVYEPTEAERRTLEQGMIIRAEASALTPILQERRELAVLKIIAQYKTGKFEPMLGLVAYLTAVEDILSTMSNKQKKAEIIERKIHGQ